MASVSTKPECDSQVSPLWHSSAGAFTHPELANEVHVWRAFLDLDFALADSLVNRLSVDERLRAERFRFAKDRRRFVVARSMLRQLLAGYLAIGDDEVSFEYGRYGKPFLTSQLNPSRLAFNLSHSESVALLVITRGRKIGVDLEFVRENLQSEEIAGQYFSKWELQELRSLPPEMRRSGFFNCWTRKEAYVKACGMGLQAPLHTFQVSLSPREPARFIRGVGGDWRLASFVPASGYIAAVASDGSPAKFTWRDWQLAPSHDCTAHVGRTDIS